jgi:glycerophosphoryl diester phosphodiesterase
MYDRRNLGRDDCTATRIHPPTHEFIENTLPSMEAAFAAGADALELDIHPTTDGEFVVFHDWTLDCRTDGSGVTRQQNLAYLRSLDLGYGYTADGGRSFPLRGKGVGLMPTLADVYRAFPGREFIINIKSNNPREAEWLSAYLERHGLLTNGAPVVYGGEKAVRRWQELFPGAAAPRRSQVKACTRDYVLWGWSGLVPEACRESTIMVPLNRTYLFWGWPNRFLARMKAAETRVLVLGIQEAESGIAGVAHPDQLEPLPAGFDGYIWIEAIETVGPVLRGREPLSPAK